jgi:peptidoglycan/xylan/chitin deacetylase (PgdA/CDA1 family)
MFWSEPDALTQVVTDDPVVALTFDDGPDPAHTPRLLDILAAHGARATFFMIGLRAHHHPDLVARVARDGHAIGNHSWDHPSFPLISRRERRRQILDCARAIAPFGERLFRPPYGHQDAASWSAARRAGHRVVAWSIVAGDWEQRDGRSMADAVIGEIRPGSVVLFHDGIFDAPDARCFPREATLVAVELLLNRLAGRLRFLTIPELLRHGTPKYQRWTFAGRKEELNRQMRQDGPARRY